MISLQKTQESEPTQCKFERIYPEENIDGVVPVVADELLGGEEIEMPSFNSHGAEEKGLLAIKQ